MNKLIYPVIIIVLVLVMTRMAKVILNKDTALDLLEINLAALSDSVTYYMDENEEIIFTKRALVSSENQLKQLNANLHRQLRSIRGKPITATEIRTLIERDTYYMPIMTVLNIDSFNFSVVDSSFWGPNDYSITAIDFDVIILRPDGTDTIPNSVAVEQIRVRQERALSLITGITESNGVLEIFIKPNTPDVMITEIHGALIDPRNSEVIKQFFPDKRWSLGPYLGYGIYGGAEGVNHGFGIGISLQYKLLSW